MELHDLYCHRYRGRGNWLCWASHDVQRLVERGRVHDPDRLLDGSTGLLDGGYILDVEAHVRRFPG